MKLLKYVLNITTQMYKIYKLKQQLDLVTVNFSKSLDKKQVLEDFEKLRSMVFDCGSIYVKFLQWYVSKLKANCVPIPGASGEQSSTGFAGASGNDSNHLEIQNIQYFITYFEDIFEHCPFHSLEHTKEIFERSMPNIKLDEYVDITTFKEIASGSIGQVYYAKRLLDGKEIAIKVKHPDIIDDLENQLDLIKVIKFLQSFKSIRQKFNLVFNLDDFLNSITEQCDFNIEANNCKRFRDNFKDSSEQIVFPDILFQSSDLLISEYIEGKSVDELTDIQKHQITINFVCFFYQMLLVDNFLHGDLHCKNWKTRISETGKPQIVVYDCGICFKNSDVTLTQDFWFSLGTYDIDKLNRVMKRFIVKNNYSISDEDISREISKIFTSILKESVGISLVLRSIIHFFITHNIVIDKYLLNISIMICLIEEFLKKNEVISRDKTTGTINGNITVSMFEIINDNMLDIIAYCEVKHCYPKVLELFRKEYINKFEKYNKNKVKNNITECNTDSLEDITKSKPMLFSTIGLSGLKMKTPE
jgi:predicted unusual protein kinase regulating ubiquinone biosynthesis (AarF/ABC1/UbiB family)